MLSNGGFVLLVAGALTTAAAVAHLVCIAIGPRAYRFMGAGERMARAVEAGRLRPTVITLVIAAVLGLWALYAFSAAGVVGPLPFTGLVLAVISLVLLARAFAVPLLRPVFPENSTTFWWVSSTACLVLGLLYATGALVVLVR